MEPTVDNDRASQQGAGTDQSSAGDASSPAMDTGVRKTEPVASAAEPLRTNSPQSSAGKAQVARARGGKWLIVLLVLAALAVAGYVAWRQYGAQFGFVSGDDPTVNSSVVPPVVVAPSPQQSMPSELQGAVDALNDRAQRQDATLRQLEGRLADLQLQSQSQQRSIQQLTTATREDWLLAEAEYLLRLANQRILTEKQGRNALSLMASTDAILKDLDDPGLFAVRKALASDITQLRLAGDVDREGIYLQLAALIDALPQLDTPMVVAADEAASTPAAEQRWYQSLADNAWRALKKLSGIVRIERVDEMAMPKLLPSQQQLVRLNLRLLLEQAQLGLLREEPAIYRASLQSAEDIISAKFAGDADAARVLEQLSELAARSVVQELPTAEASIKALHDYIALWHERDSPTAEPAADVPAEAPAAVEGDQP